MHSFELFTSISQLTCTDKKTLLKQIQQRKNMFSSFLIHERRRPPLSAGVALPTAQYHNCVVFNISVERTEHALNNILYREKVLYIRIIEKLKENLSVLKIFPASVSKDGNQGIVQSTRCVYCTCLYRTRILSDVKTEGRRTLNATLWERKGWTGMTPAVLAESTRVSGLSV